MKSYSSNQRSLLTVWGLVILLGLLKFGYQQTNLLSFDYFGLYLHLPATFIYHDPAVSDISWLEKINETYNNTPTFYQLQKEGQYNIIRFFNGIAILLSPFFFLGHLLANMSQYPADGFSYPYQLAMMIAAWFYVIVGLIFTRKVLLKYFDDTTTSLTLIALYLGTNLIFWSTFDAGAPHTILLSFYAMLLWFTIRWHEEQKKRFAVAIGLLLGLIIVSRPSDIVAFLIPLFWNVYDKASLKNKIRLIQTHFGQVILLAFFTFLAGLPQLLYFYTFTGNFIYSTYTDPQSGFDFTNPRFGWVLFSFRKGWLIYAPLMVFALLGFIPLWKKHKALAPALLLHFAVNLFLIAAFTSLISYGWRAFIQSYALLALPLAAFISLILKKKWFVKSTAALLLIFFIWLSAIQGWQIINEMIDPSRMTKAYYLKIFGKLEKSFLDYKLLRIDPYLDDVTQNMIPDTTQFVSKVIYFNDFNSLSASIDPYDSTNHVFKLSTENPYSPGIKRAHEEITTFDHIWARISFDYLNFAHVSGEQVLLVATYVYRGQNKKNHGKSIKYRTFGINDTSPGNWEHFSIDYLSPELLSNKSQLQVYVWSPDGDEIFIDNFSVKIYE
ncbi:MAG: hypothetical protein PF694_03090 [Bacteroidetes bacterium]|jgi:hypothetical protein|nr:hypothetical protein [Bacteroidota bacterium]